MNKHDSVFLKKFSLVIAFLLLVTLGLILFAHHLNQLLPPEVTPQARAQEEARITPVGAVYAGQEGIAQQLAAAEAAQAAASSTAAYGGTLDGAVIYQNLCGACHTSGVGNAPTLDHSHWDARIAQGNDTLYRHAIEGFTGPDGGVMPPKGGNPGLTEEQIHATVDWMLANLK